MVNWDNLRRFEDWADALDTLLDAAAAAARNEDVSAMVVVQKDLRTFRKRSPNESCRRLDELAREAITDLAESAVEDAVRGILERSSSLDDYIKDLNSVSASTERTAKWLSLESPGEIAKSLTDVVAGIKEIGSEVPNLTDAESVEGLLKKVDGAISAISKLREAVENV